MMKQIRVSGFKIEDKENVEQILGSMGFRFSPCREECSILAVASGARLGELADLRTQLKKLDSRIRLTDIDV